MQKSVLALLVLACLAVVSQGAIHAVLTAGSKSYSNYRHQADICHAYQLLISNGIPAENIIVMAYNDIAHNPQNPVPGTLFNKPTAAGTPGDNVYAGCVIDYEGDDVSPENYLAVITGDASKVTGGNGRVLQSTAQDEVFLNFSDHGEPGAIDFPNFGDKVMADQLNAAFDTMTEKKMFKQLTYYLETCYSGSMFQQTKTNTNIYAVSAANPNESSWAAYCPPQATVDGTAIHSCLGDLFSVNWMENTESSDLSSETLQEQFQIVHDKTDASDVMQWGDVSFTDEVIGTFLGSGKNTKGFLSKMNNLFKPIQQRVNEFQLNNRGIQSVKNVETNYLLDQFQRNPTEENYNNLQKDLETTKFFNQVFEKFNAAYLPKNKINRFGGSTDFTCYRYLQNELYSKFRRYLNDYSKDHLLSLYDFCADASIPNYKNVTFSL